MDFRVLGPLQFRQESGRVIAPVRRKPRTLLALLLLNPNRSVATDVLVDSLWPRKAPASVTANLQSYVSDLRRALHSSALPGRERIVMTRGGYRLRVEQDELDAVVFERLVAEGRRHHANGLLAAAADSLLRAMALWRGPVLDGLVLPQAMQLEAARLEELRVAALENTFDTRLALGEHAGIVLELLAVTARHPLRERFWAQLMLALYRCGRRAEALDAYQRCCRLLDQHLAVRPGQALGELHRRIVAGASELELPTSGDTGAPPVAPRQLPADISAFAGRAEHLRRLDTIAAPGGRPNCILAVTGIAGVGKTALAVHWAHRAAGRFPDGQLFLNLRGFDSAAPPMPSAAAIRILLEALGVSADRMPVTIDGQVGLYRSILAGRRMLVLLDNARNAEQVRPLLPGAPASLAIVTSRDRLTGLAAADGAQILPVGRPDPGEARSLLAGRVGERRAEDEPQAVAELVEACARLPLALANVAAHACAHPQLSLTTFANRLRSSAGALTALTGEDAAAWC